MKIYNEVIGFDGVDTTALLPRKFDFFADGGHGWLKVKLSLLVELGIAEKITISSYYRNGWVYLEEDRDMSRFCYAMKDKGFKVLATFNHTNKQSKIRGYEYYMDCWVELYRNSLMNTKMAF